MGAHGAGSGSGKRLKKKDLRQPEKDAGALANRLKAYQSAFATKKSPTEKKPGQVLFLPPEAFGSSVPGDDGGADTDLDQASAWDIAVRYHELKARASLKDRTRELRRISAQAVLDRARAVLGSVTHPVSLRSTPLRELPGDARQVDFDLDETLENSPLSVASAMGAVPGGCPSLSLTEDDLWMSHSVPRIQPVVLTVDTSLSMTGEKLALTAVALAVVLLEFPEDPVGIVAFENEAKVLKTPLQRITLQELVERFLDVPAQGYTHLEDGLKSALQQVRSLDGGAAARPPSVVLLTDGKYTAGRDPAYLAPRFSHLIVLKMGKERASLELCRELAIKGHGALREVGELEELPNTMYAVVKDLLRGRSSA